MLMLVVVGSLLPIHVRRGWHQRRNLPLGIALSSVLLLHTLSGYALYYFGGEEARAWISLFHWGIGVASALVLVWHVACGAVSRGAAFPRRKSADSTLRATRRAQRTGEPRAGEKKRRRETGGA
jgi:hypothetical protein